MTTTTTTRSRGDRENQRCCSCVATNCKYIFPRAHKYIFVAKKKKKKLRFRAGLLLPLRALIFAKQFRATLLLSRSFHHEMRNLLLSHANRHTHSRDWPKFNSNRTHALDLFQAKGQKLLRVTHDRARCRFADS